MFITEAVSDSLTFRRHSPFLWMLNPFQPQASSTLPGMLWPQEPTLAEEQDKAGYKYGGVNTPRSSLQAMTGWWVGITVRHALLYLPPVLQRGWIRGAHGSNLNTDFLYRVPVFLWLTSPLFLWDHLLNWLLYIHLLVLGSAVGKSSLTQKSDATVQQSIGEYWQNA